MQVHFILIDYENRQDVFNKYFGECASWNSYWGPLEKLKSYDCVVTPGNSFGDLSGGFDLSIINVFGAEIQKNLWDYLKKRYPSENVNDNSWDCSDQPIGTSILIKTGTKIAKYLCHTPTMEFARKIQDKPNVYMAMNSVLYEILKHNTSCAHSYSSHKNYIKTVVIPFMGTGFGELSYEESAKQMYHAYHYFKTNYPMCFK